MVRGGHLLLAVAEKPTLWNLLVEQSPQLGRIKPQGLAESLHEVVDGSPATPAMPAVAEPPRTISSAGSATPALDRFTLDLTALAAAGKLDAVLGRDREIDQCVQALSRRRQNNPILVGDAGVGKTAIVEGLAVRLARGEVDSPLLRSAVMRSLDLGALQAGAGVRGEFEQRLRAVVDEVRASPVPVVLFVDEAHMLLGAGGAEGVGDAANLLKPALARGELRCDRGHHLGGVQAVLRAGRGPVPAVRAGEGERAGRADGVPDAAGDAAGAGAAPRRAGAGRGGDGGGGAVASGTCRAGSCRTRPWGCWTRPARRWR